MDTMTSLMATQGVGDETGSTGSSSPVSPPLPPMAVKAHVTVAVRVKGLDPIGMHGDEDDVPAVYPHEGEPGRSLVIDGQGGRGAAAFTFDHCFWSLGPSKSKYPAFVKTPAEATQEAIYRELGAPVVKNTLQGYNCSIFAYGQTGSGKTFTMMGPGANQHLHHGYGGGAAAGGEDDESLRGLIPRISEALFEATINCPGASVEVNAVGRYEVTHSFIVSYVEIYMERVHDLLVENTERAGLSSAGLKIREHPKTGPYVDGVTLVRVHSLDQIRALIELGNRNRAVAATSLNSYSSRSHAVFTIQYIKTRKDAESGALLHQTSKLNLIDLAGSENAGSAGTTGERLKEGGSINRSLLTLGLVIKALADKSQQHRGGGSRGGPKLVIPYRDSVLTFLLKDSLGGNSRTTVLATVRPGLAFYEESLSTLKYASRARTIVNTAIINEDPLTRKIRLLQEQIEALNRELACSHEREAANTMQLQAMTQRLMLLTGGTDLGTMGMAGAGLSFKGTLLELPPMHTMAGTSTQILRLGASDNGSGGGGSGGGSGLGLGLGAHGLDATQSSPEAVPASPSSLALQQHALSPHSAAVRALMQVSGEGEGAGAAGESDPQLELDEQLASGGRRRPPGLGEEIPSEGEEEEGEGEGEEGGGATPSTVVGGEEEQQLPAATTPTTDDMFTGGAASASANPGTGTGDGTGPGFGSPHPRRPISAKALRPIPGLKEGISSPPLIYDQANAVGTLVTRGRGRGSSTTAAAAAAAAAGEGSSSPRKSSIIAVSGGGGGGGGGMGVGVDGAGAVAAAAAPLSPFQAGARVHDGFLFKRGQLTGACQRRWCVVRGSRLFWFLRYQDEESIRGALSLRDCDVDVLSPEGDPRAGGLPFAFAIRSRLDPDARTHVLQASSAEERDKWVSALRLAALMEDDLEDQLYLQEPLARLLHTPCPIM